MFFVLLIFRFRKEYRQIDADFSYDYIATGTFPEIQIYFLFPLQLMYTYTVLRIFKSVCNDFLFEFTFIALVFFTKQDNILRICKPSNTLIQNSSTEIRVSNLL